MPIDIAPLDACGFSTYAYIKINQSARESARLRGISLITWLFRNLPAKWSILFGWVADALQCA